ncbi:hypothetical protein [Herpetosiphon giganteus]|uniref:hypothetical protein n=1 Tax=Herpetosiphon giganteus TaxID=2029754 RepID=UPI00195A1D66|nr:hypothetical protein [Herpetosiphon giganteus]MBM7844836.1 hypothetical protein [Herpetosiphon giganteus]
MNYLRIATVFMVLGLMLVLAACGTAAPSAACYPLNEIEQRAEIAFLPADTVRLSYEATSGENYQESPYYGVVRVVMGSMQNTSSVFQTYSDYLQQQGWTQDIAYAHEIMWSKEALTLRIIATDPNNSRGIPAESKQVHRTWYVLLLGESKASECSTTTIPK